MGYLRRRCYSARTIVEGPLEGDWGIVGILDLRRKYKRARVDLRRCQWPGHLRTTGVHGERHRVRGIARQFYSGDHRGDGQACFRPSRTGRLPDGSRYPSSPRTYLCSEDSCSSGIFCFRIRGASIRKRLGRPGCIPAAKQEWR
jgi:hypothetical protein